MYKMHKTRYFFDELSYFVSVICLILLGCGVGDGEQSQPVLNQKIMVAGSTSVQPIAEKLAEHYMKTRPDIKIEVQGGGSSAGIQAARSGVAQIGTSSRELKEEEHDLIPTIVSYDAIIIIVHPDNPLSNITLKQVRDIFAYKTQDWENIIEGKNGQITIITREEGSGTRGAFEELVMGKEEIADRCLVQDSTGAVREVVSNDPNAIGYISYGGLNSGVKALPVEGIFPNMENFLITDKVKRYKLIRPFLFVTPKKPDGLPLEFIQYIFSKEGADILKQEGLIPNE